MYFRIIVRYPRARKTRQNVYLLVHENIHVHNTSTHNIYILLTRQ